MQSHKKLQAATHKSGRFAPEKFTGDHLRWCGVFATVYCHRRSVHTALLHRFVSQCVFVRNTTGRSFFQTLCVGQAPLFTDRNEYWRTKGDQRSASEKSLLDQRSESIAQTDTEHTAGRAFAPMRRNECGWWGDFGLWRGRCGFLVIISVWF